MWYLVVKTTVCAVIPNRTGPVRIRHVSHVGHTRRFRYGHVLDGWRRKRRAGKAHTPHPFHLCNPFAAKTTSSLFGIYILTHIRMHTQTATYTRIYIYNIHARVCNT